MQGDVTRGNFFLQFTTQICVKKILQVSVEFRYIQVAVYDRSICDYFELRSVTGGDFSCNLQLKTQRE